jgi:hypothetical protein
VRQNFARHWHGRCIKKDLFTTQNLSTKYNERTSAEISTESRAQQLGFPVARTQGAAAPSRSSVKLLRNCKAMASYMADSLHRVRRERESKPGSGRIEVKRSCADAVQETAQGERGMISSRVHRHRPPAPPPRRSQLVRRCAGGESEREEGERERVERGREDRHRRCPIRAREP